MGFSHFDAAQPQPEAFSILQFELLNLIFGSAFFP
jgi:hypothetical protein